MDANLEALKALRDSAEVAELLARFEGLQRENEASDAWDTPAGRKVEAVTSYLRMALEAADTSRR